MFYGHQTQFYATIISRSIQLLPTIMVCYQTSTISLGMYDMVSNYLNRDLATPAQYEEFRNSFVEGNTYILKPSDGYQGAGIVLAQKWEHVKRITEGGSRGIGGSKEFIAQLYIANPLLLDGYKFDFR
jgi:hypothetical protein